jgi:hypothetical protein
MKRKLETERKCIQCGERKSIFSYAIVWGNDLDDSYVRRVCNTCDPKPTIASTDRDRKAIEKECAKLLRKKQKLLAQVDDIETTMNEKLKQALHPAERHLYEPQRTDDELDRMELELRHAVAGSHYDGNQTKHMWAEALRKMEDD